MLLFYVGTTTRLENTQRAGKENIMVNKKTFALEQAIMP
jgi:hypothetical protein